MEGLVRQARDQEAIAEKLIEKLAGIEKTISSSSIECVTGENLNPEAAIANKLDKKLDELKSTAAQIRQNASTKAEQTYANQFSSTHQFLQKEFKRICSNIRTQRSQNQLVGKGSDQSATDNSHVRLLVRESNSLENGLETTGRILSAASAIQTSYGKQREQLLSTQDKVVNFAETLPGINVLLQKIERRKRFNAIVLAVAIAVCVCLLLLYTF